MTAAPTPGRQRFPPRAGSHQLLKPKGQREEKPQLCSKLKERRRGGCRRQTRDLRPLLPTQRAAGGSEAPSYGRAEGREERAGAARPCPAAPPCAHSPRVSIQPHPTSLASLTPAVPNVWGHGMSCWVSLRKRPGDLSSSRPSPPLLFVPGWVQHLHLLPPPQPRDRHLGRPRHSEPCPALSRGSAPGGKTKPRRDVAAAHTGSWSPGSVRGDSVPAAARCHVPAGGSAPTPQGSADGSGADWLLTESRARSPWSRAFLARAAAPGAPADPQVQEDKLVKAEETPSLSSSARNGGLCWGTGVPRASTPSGAPEAGEVSSSRQDIPKGALALLSSVPSLFCTGNRQEANSGAASFSAGTGGSKPG